MMDWSKRQNINIAAVVTIVQCSTLVERCSRQLIGPVDWVFVTLGRWDPYAVISLVVVPTVHIVTQWSGSVGIEAYLSGQLASFRALTVGYSLMLTVKRTY